MAVQAQDIGGQPHLCGVWARSKVLSAYIDGSVRDVLEKGVVQSGGATLMRDFRVFRQVDPAPSYAGMTANCVPVGHVGAKLVVRIPTQTVTRERGLDSAIQVRFKPTRKKNPAMTDGTIRQKKIFKQESDKLGMGVN